MACARVRVLSVSGKRNTRDQIGSKVSFTENFEFVTIISEDMKENSCNVDEMNYQVEINY